MKHFFCFLGLLCAFFGGAAQENRGLTGLRIGDLVPDVALGRVFNGAGLPLRLSGFRGKLLIIDFWSTYCGTCVRAMPRLDSLQRAVGDGLVILPVTVEGEERVLAMRRRNRLLQGLGLPLVLGDRVLGELFPHRMVPHDVWIGPDGRVLGFTEVWDITGERVRGVMAGGALKVVMKQDVLDYDRGRPLLVNGNGGNDSAFLYRSLLTGYLRGLPSGMGVETDSLRGLMRVRATNVTARYLYTLAYRGLRFLPEVRITGPARKRLLPEVPAGTDLDSAHVYGYDLCLPGRSAALARQAIRQDLDRFFRVRTAWVDRDTLGLVLLPVARGRVGALPATGELQLPDGPWRGGSTAELVRWLNLPGGVVILDSARRKLDRPLALDGGLFRLDVLNRELSPYGLCLVRRRVRLQELRVSFPEAVTTEPFTL